MTITTEEKYLLNNKFGKVANKVQLGTLIENAEAVVASEIALADGKVLIGNASNVGAAQTVSGDITLSSAGAASIANTAVSLEHLDSGIAPSHVVKYAGEATTAGGGAAEAITVSGVAATDIVLANIKTQGATPRTILTVVPTTNTITVTFSGDPSTDHVVYYMVLRAAA